MLQMYAVKICFASVASANAASKEVTVKLYGTNLQFDVSP